MVTFFTETFRSHKPHPLSDLTSDSSVCLEQDIGKLCTPDLTLWDAPLIEVTRTIEREQRLIFYLEAPAVNACLIYVC